MVRPDDGHPAPEAIAARAYELFLSRGRTHGYDLADWFAAESQLAQASARPAVKRARRQLVS
jgi:hypothetical protein